MKHILLAQSTDPSSRLVRNTQNLTGQYGLLTQEEDLQADTSDPMCRDDMDPVVGSSAVADGLESARGRCHLVPAKFEVGQLAKGEQCGE
jgi:hypothetical protein